MVQPIAAGRQFTYWFNRELKQTTRIRKPAIQRNYLKMAKAMQNGEEIPLKNLDNVFIMAYFNTLRKLNPEACVAWLNKISEQIKKARLS